MEGPEYLQPRSSDQSPDTKYMMHATPDFDDGPMEDGMHDSSQSFLGDGSMGGSSFMGESQGMGFQPHQQQQEQQPHQHSPQAGGTLLPDVGGDNFMRDLLDPLMVQQMLTQTGGEQAVARAAQQASEPWSCPTCAAWNHPQHSMCARCMIAKPY